MVISAKNGKRKEISMNVFEIIKQLNSNINIIDTVICLSGLILLARWLLKTSWGLGALADSIPRRNNMSFYLPFIPILVWFGPVPLALWTREVLLPDLQDWRNALLNNIILCAGAAVTVAVIVFFARVSFARRLKGFGLNIKTIIRDFFAAVANLLAVWPLVLVAIIVTTFLGRLVYGQDYQLQPHPELESISTYSQLPVRVVIVLTTVLVGPVMEEMLFRGLFQTMIRSLFDARPDSRTRGQESTVAHPEGEAEGSTPEQSLKVLWSSKGAWLAIFVSSVLFAIAHPNRGHWPALFVLGVGLGYSYEKSGSLFRPIFMHAFFNGITIVAVLSQ